MAGGLDGGHRRSPSTAPSTGSPTTSTPASRSSAAPPIWARALHASGSSTRCATACSGCPGGRCCCSSPPLGLAGRHLAHRADRRRSPWPRSVCSGVWEHVPGHALPGARRRWSLTAGRSASRRHPRRRGSERLERLLRPVLDVMQTMPQFVYLIPVVALFGVGRAPAITAAVVYALPAVIRITTQGLREVDPAAMEASRSLGATGRQQLRQVQLPAGPPGAAARRQPGRRAGARRGRHRRPGRRRRARLRRRVTASPRATWRIGLVAGVAIVCLGLMLDRVTQPAGSPAPRVKTGDTDPCAFTRSETAKTGSHMTAEQIRVPSSPASACSASPP